MAHYSTNLSPYIPVISSKMLFDQSLKIIRYKKSPTMEALEII